MEKFFNTAGPINPEDHFCVPPLSRWNLDEILKLIDQKKYFILHAPRQTGKTSSLLALMNLLNKEGKYRALYINVEMGQAARENVMFAMKAILGEIEDQALHGLNDPFPGEVSTEILQKKGPHGALGGLLTAWCDSSTKPIILLIDEIDALIGDTLISVLRQIRAGYPHRPVKFPQSIILCGVRDIKDYRIHSSTTKEIITGGSAFNIKAKSLRLGNLNQEEAFCLLEQHTSLTGQIFERQAKIRIFELTQGQPWLVNSLAYQVTNEMENYRDHAKNITVAAVEQAKEELILSRTSHLDQLADKLQEERVRRVIEPLLAGESGDQVPYDDVLYCLDLGLIRLGVGQRREIANPIYQEVIPRELSLPFQTELTPKTKTPFILEDKTLDFNALLLSFQDFFRRHSESWIERFEYKEAGFQLLLQAFLQRIINGGGTIHREYGLGRGRTDLIIEWPNPKGVQTCVIELKVRGLKESLKSVIKEGLDQVVKYADQCGAEEIHLMVFDRDSTIKWASKIYRRNRKHLGKTVVLWGV